MLPLYIVQKYRNLLKNKRIFLSLKSKLKTSMKKSISFLPKHKQDELNYITSLIRDRLPQAEMIILFGSYARNQYVDYDSEQYDKVSKKVSDYDILVITSKGITDKDAGKMLDNVEQIWYGKGKDNPKQPPVQFINENIKNLNKALEEGRYFYTEIKEQGIMLYNSGIYKLARKRKLKFDEIKLQAEEYFESKFKRANSFLEDVRNAYNREDYVQASFYLHQSAENYYYAINLVFTQENRKQHNLSKLGEAVKNYSEDLEKVFPRNTEEESRLFDLIKSAYVDARYNADFVVTKEDIEALIPKVELLRDITKRICEQRIKEYGEMRG